MLAFSVAYELEIAGLVRMLNAARIPARRRDRDARHPLILAGGPLTFSNPMPLAAIVDAIVVGEADSRVVTAVRAARGGTNARRPARRPREDPARLRADAPHGAAARRRRGRRAAPRALRDSHAAHRALRHVSHRDRARVLARLQLLRDAPVDERRHAHRPHGARPRAVPGDARRVGLVGAAVSDHPKIVPIVNALADRGCEVGLSSLRPDRLANTTTSSPRSRGSATAR